MDLQTSIQTGYLNWYSGAYKTAPKRLASDIDPLAFETGYFRGCEMGADMPEFQMARYPFKADDGFAIGLWKGYTDLRYGKARDFSYACIEAYNELVMERKGIYGPWVESRISLVDFEQGYFDGWATGKKSPHGIMMALSAYQMGFLKAKIDRARFADRRRCMVLAYNEAEMECRRLGLVGYGWRSRTPLTQVESDSLGLSVQDFTSEVAAWSWIWQEETTASKHWKSLPVMHQDLIFLGPAPKQMEVA